MCPKCNASDGIVVPVCLHSVWQGFKALGKMLHSNKTITELRLAGNEADQDGVVSLAGKYWRVLPSCTVSLSAVHN